MQIPSPDPKYSATNEAETRRILEQEISRLANDVRELQRRLTAAGIP